MKVIRLRGPAGIERLVFEQAEVSKPGPGEVTVAFHGSSLNNHDRMVVMGMMPVADGLIPLSDGGGEIVEKGPGVDEFKVGDRVISVFFPAWQGGAIGDAWRVMRGDTIDGCARELATLPVSALTLAPRGYDHAEAACVVCAGMTAWRGLVVDGGLKPGDVVLVQGTGGVAVFALQFAKAAGARVIAVSSSDEKLARMKSLGADHLINYRTNPDWGELAAQMSGRGVDHVVEVGGAGTLAQSVKAAGIGGHIALIGLLGGTEARVDVTALMGKQLRLIGVTVGSRQDQQAMVRAIDASGIRPVIDRRFALEDISDAFRYLESGQHVGKVALTF